MRLSCQQEQLHRGLSAVARAIPARTTLPITQHILFDASGDTVLLSATDAETIAITYSIPAEIDEPGSITMPSRLVSDFVATLPSETIMLSLAGRAKQVSLSCARNTASIGGLDPEDFPPIPPVDNAASLTLNSDRLRKAINQTVFAAATDDSRPVLTGVNIEISSDEICFAAADGFRLAVYEGKLLEPISEPMEFIIPARALQEVGRLIGTDDTAVEFTVTTAGTHALFNIGNVEIVSQLMPGSFPNFRSLIPSEHKNRVIVQNSDFARAVKTSSIFARDGSGILRIQIMNDEDGGKLSISSRTEEVGDNQGDIDGVVEGDVDDDSKIAFNNKYLAEVLDVLGEGEVAFEMTSPSSPGVVRATDKDGYTHVVMPMFVQW